jgi:5-methylcytosine-specific restriction endonuclease McrA
MSISMYCEMPNGKVWGVGCGLFLSRPDDVDPANIVIPINQMGGMTDEQIGQYARLLIQEARLCEALELSEIIAFLNLRHVALDELSDWFTELQEFEDNENIKNTLALIEQEIESKQRRKKAKASKAEKRREIRSNYEKLLVQIGRRDGFACAQCGISANDVQVDHIVPLAEGGSNDLDNLQLLCPACNSRKSDKIPEEVAGVATGKSGRHSQE